ncbi:hypothetical protein CFP56_004722 [Quercus suber]|uniref:Uncharacterized protein n=1 Tax=Quercus suber TaxID=58331 RepID=A0AAW0M820_QUESU
MPYVYGYWYNDAREVFFIKLAIGAMVPTFCDMAWLAGFFDISWVQLGGKLSLSFSKHRVVEC